MAYTPISTIPESPNRQTDTPTQFSNKTDNLLSALPTFVEEVNNAGDYFDNINASVEANKNDAEAAAEAAVGVANYKGDWTVSTNVLQGESYSYNGAVWVAKVNSVGQTPSEGTYWFKGIGTAGFADLTTSPTATSGVLQAGDGGLLAAVSSLTISDFDAFDLASAQNGAIFSYSNITTNQPPSLVGTAGSVRVEKRSIATVGAISLITNQGERATRLYSAGIWGDWIYDFSSKNVADSASDFNTLTPSNIQPVTPVGFRAALNVSGTAPMSVIRAWVNFDGSAGSPSINEDLNIASITENATGDWTLTFTTAMPDANYAIVGMSANSSGNNQNIQLHSTTQGGAPTLKTTTQVRVVYNGGGGFIAGNNISIMVVR